MTYCCDIDVTGQGTATRLAVSAPSELPTHRLSTSTNPHLHYGTPTFKDNQNLRQSVVQTFQRLQRIKNTPQVLQVPVSALF